MSDEATQHYNTTEQAYNAGLRKGKELQKQAAEEEREHEGGESKLTMEDVRAMSPEEHIERKVEVDAFLEEQSQ